MHSRIKSQLAEGQAGAQGTGDNAITGYRRLSLRAELATGFAAVIVLTLVVGFVSLSAQNRSIEAVNKLVAVVGRIADLSLRSNVAMMRFRLPSFTQLTSRLPNSNLLDHQPSEILHA